MQEERGFPGSAVLIPVTITFDKEYTKNVIDFFMQCTILFACDSNAAIHESKNQSMYCSVFYCPPIINEAYSISRHHEVSGPSVPISNHAPPPKDVFKTCMGR